MEEIMWYSDWRFWSAVVAWISLLMNVWPKIKPKIFKGKLSLNKMNQVFLNHFIGNPNLNWYLILKNTGGQPVSVKRIDLELKCNGSEQFQLTSLGFWNSQIDAQLLMFTPFDILPGESWGKNISFQTVMSRREQMDLRGLISNLREDLQKPVSPQSPSPSVNNILGFPPAPSLSMPCVSDDNLKKVNDFFEKNFKWQSGEYQVEISIIGEQGVLHKEKVSFTIFEKESDELLSHRNEYVYGYGICNPNSYKQTGINISLYGK